MKHRQGPQIDRVFGHGRGDDIGLGQQIGAAVVVDHTLRIAGGAGCVVEGDGVPLVAGKGPVKIRVARLKKRLVVERAQTFAVLGKFRDRNSRSPIGETVAISGTALSLTTGCVFPVGDQHLAFGVVQLKGDDRRRPAWCSWNAAPLAPLARRNGPPASAGRSTA